MGEGMAPAAERQDFGVLVNLAGVVFLDALVAHLHERGFVGFTMRTGWVIRSVGEEPVSLRDLAARMNLSSPGALKAIDPMVTAGYLERVSTSDRRVRAVAVTDLGREASRVAREFHRSFEESLAEELGPQGAAATRRALEAIVARGSRHIPQALVLPEG